MDEEKKENITSEDENIDEVDVDQDVEKASDEGVYKLRHPIMFENNEITEIKIDSLREIKGRDIETARRLLRQTSGQLDPAATMYDSPEFCFALLQIKTGTPPDVINELRSWDYILLHNVVRNFLAI